MNEVDFWKLYSEWLQNVNSDCLWFMHRLMEVKTTEENQKRRADALSGLAKIKRQVGSARKIAESQAAKHAPGINIGESIE